MNIVISSKLPTLGERRAELWRLTRLFGVWVTTSFRRDHDVSFLWLLWLPIDAVKSRRFPGENSDDLPVNKFWPLASITLVTYRWVDAVTYVWTLSLTAVQWSMSFPIPPLDG